MNPEMYTAALTLVELLIAIDPEPDSAEGKLLTVLAAAVENYEKSAFPIDG